MICVLGAPEDDDALWLAAALTQRGERVEFVLPEDLMVGSRLNFRVETQAASACLTLRDGRILDDRELELVVNRLDDLPAVGGGCSPADAAYQQEEWRAALAAWLRIVPCPVVNPPWAASLQGPVLPSLAWRAAGAAHGLPAAPWRSGEDVQADAELVELICLGGRCFGAHGAALTALSQPLVALAASVGVPLLGASFVRDGERWAFLDATVRPRLAAAGMPLIDALIDGARQRQAAPWTD